MRWNENKHTDSENLQWSWLRAVEWGAFPVFVTQPIIPIFIFFFDWKIVIGGIIVFNWLWNPIKYKYINLNISTIAARFIYFSKWILCVGFGIYFLINKDYFLAGLCCLYPLLSGIIGGINIPVKIGSIQQKIMEQLGYEKGEDKQYHPSDKFHNKLKEDIKEFSTNLEKNIDDIWKIKSEEFSKELQKEREKIEKKSIEEYYNRGLDYGKQGKYDLAVAEFNSVLKINPQDARAYYNRGLYYAKQHKDDLSIADFKKAVDLGNSIAKEDLRLIFGIDY